MKLLIDLTRMTKAQREFAAGVILQFPPATLEVDNEVDGVDSHSSITVVAVGLGHDSTSEVLTPETVFDRVPSTPVVQVPATVAATGPHLVIPSPPPPPLPPPPPGVSDDAAVAAGIDKAGIPWNERIHSSSKATTADGLWRKRRGVSDEEISQVETELRALMSIPKPPAVNPTPAESPIVPAATVPPPPAVNDDRMAFVAFIKKTNAAMQEKKITKEEVNAVCAGLGIPSLALVGNRLDLVPQLSQMIDQLIG